MSPRRPDDRDRLVRKDTPLSGVPAIIPQDITNRIEDPDARAMARRAHRTTDERVAHLEAKYDKLADKYDRLVQSVIGSRTKIIIAIVGAVSAVAGYLLAGCT